MSRIPQGAPMGDGMFFFILTVIALVIVLVVIGVLP